MITPAFFFEQLKNAGVEFYAGVPDSLLKSFCAYVTDHSSPRNHVIAANEGAAVGLGAGYYLATSKCPLIYLQNSGIGNAVNPILSLLDQDVYRIPAIFLVGWRGEPGVKDEPQHVKQGKVTLQLFDAMGVRNVVMADDEITLNQQIRDASDYVNISGQPFCFIARKDTFADYKLREESRENNDLTREVALEIVVRKLDANTVVVSTTGMLSRELFEIRERNGQSHSHDFLTVGSMGHASQIALGIAMQKRETSVACLDGDGALLMHMGSLAIVGANAPPNFKHVVFNNGAHDSVGGQPTVAGFIDLPTIASACKYRNVYSVNSIPELERILPEFSAGNGPSFLEIKIKKGARKELGRPTTTPQANKSDFMEFLKN